MQPAGAEDRLTLRVPRQHPTQPSPVRGAYYQVLYPVGDRPPARAPSIDQAPGPRAARYRKIQQ